jgi:hypothetical protein
MTQPQATTPRPSTWSRIPSAHKWALLPALLGFVLDLEFTASSTHNGVQTSCTYVDIAGPVLGVIAIVMAVAGVRADRREHPSMRLRNAVLAIAAVYVVVASWHIVSGIGLVGGPCN